MYRYFAYGSTLSVPRTREWCDSHGVDPAPFLAGRPAVLEGHRLEFRVPSRYWGGLVGDLVASPGEAVHGVLFDLADAARPAVQHKEGAVTGLFREIAVTVSTADGPASAFTFAAEPSRVASPGEPSPAYLDALITGGEARGLPASWLDRLRALR